MSLFGGNMGATSTPAKPGGLFSSFSTGSPATGQASAFGAPATSAPAFGGFGTNVTSQAPPAFGASQPTLGGFGTLGQAAATASSTAGFGGFGTTNTLQSGGGGGLFSGSANTSTAFGGFGAGNTTTSAAAPAFSGFGTNTAVSSSAGGGFGGFGTTATTSTAPAFGGFGTNQTTTGFGGLGTSFGSNFGKPAMSTVTPGFGSFGGATNFMLGQPQQQQQAPQINAEANSSTIFRVSIFGDERDGVLSKWNYLQAMWGTGKAFYSQTAPAVEITPHIHLCRFKAMGYSRLPGKENKYGLVALNFNKPLSEVKPQQQQLINSLSGVFGNKPNLAVNIDQMKEHEEKKCQVVIYVEEKASPPGVNETKRLFATDVANYLNQANIKAQLNNMGVSEALALVQPDEDQLRDYLENPPNGIDPRMWRQAKLDNPDPKKLIPVPIIGFNTLKWRTKCQENETEMHALYLQKVEKELSDLRQRYTTSTARIMEHKRLLAELSHKILTIIVKQECTRKVGLALTPEEETLRTKLENMQALVSAPTQFKGRLSELLSQMRMQGSQYTSPGEYTVDKDNEEEIKQFLSMQQKAMEVLTDTVTKDLKALRMIHEGMPELVRN